MKKITRVASVLAISFCLGSTFLLSCSDDDTPSLGNEELANEQNATEENLISVTQLNSGVELVGATKESGTPPAPNSTMDFRINTDKQTAVQRRGFEIKFSSDDAIAGAYVRLKNVDSTPMDGYFKIPSSMFNNFRVADELSSNGRLVNIQEEYYDFEIGVRFDESISAGQFCYDICLYDDENNISQVQEVCLEVEAWGGNAAMVGTWKLVGGVHVGHLSDMSCIGGGSIKGVDHYKEVKKEIIVTFNRDGSFTEKASVEGYYIDYEETVSSCTLVYDTEKDIESRRLSGNWAFDEEQNIPIIVCFNYEDFLDPSRSTEINKGKGELYISDNYIATIIGNTLTLEYNGVRIEGYQTIVFERQ